MVERKKSEKRNVDETIIFQKGVYKHYVHEIFGTFPGQYEDSYGHSAAMRSPFILNGMKWC